MNSAKWFTWLRAGIASLRWPQVWGEQDRTSERLIVLDDTNHGAIRGHASAIKGQNWGGAFFCRADGLGTEGIGAYAAAESHAGAASWGLNAFAIAYAPSCVAVGAEISAHNMSGGSAPVFALDVGTGGNAPAEAIIRLNCSLESAEGKAKVGLLFGGPDTDGNPNGAASECGVKIGRIDSGEALNVMGQRIALSPDGEVFLHYNTATKMIELVKAGMVVLSL